jgi:addiction module HigA family antidote
MADFDAVKRPAWEPSHPGAILRQDVLPALGMKPADAARRIGVSRQALHNILAEKSAITPDMALRLGKLCGNGPGLWMRLQVARDLWQAEVELAGALAAIERA